ncbi:MAG: hypothetical protein J2P49_07540 [Methylocapsa sp.]|nr:hypothetical protein [Methylocapsa sp.]
MASQKRFNFGRAGGLFNQKTIKRALHKAIFNEQQLAAAKDWAAQVRHPKFSKAKETSVRGEFIQKVLVTILGYTPYRPGETFTLATEEALGKGAVDTALGTFSGSDRNKRTVLAPFELKGPGTADLDAIMPRRNKRPVQQAWEYAIDAPGAKWCWFRIARKSASMPSAMAGSFMRHGISRASTNRASTSGFGCSSAREISSPAAPPLCSTKARTNKRTSPISFT